MGLPRPERPTATSHLQDPMTQIGMLLRQLQKLNTRCKTKTTPSNTPLLYMAHQICKRTAQCDGGQPIGNDCRSTSKKAKQHITKIRELTDEQSKVNPDFGSKICNSHAFDESTCELLLPHCIWDPDQQKCRQNVSHDPIITPKLRRNAELAELNSRLSTANAKIDADVSNFDSASTAVAKYRAPEQPPNIEAATFPVVYRSILNNRPLSRFDFPLWKFTLAWQKPKLDPTRYEKYIKLWNFAENVTWRHKLRLMKDTHQDLMLLLHPETDTDLGQERHRLQQMVHNMLLKSPDRREDENHQSILEKAFKDGLFSPYTRVDYFKIFVDRDITSKDQLGPLPAHAEPYIRQFNEKKHKIPSEKSHVLEWLLLGFFLKNVEPEHRNLWLDISVFPVAIVLRDTLGSVKDWSIGDASKPAELVGRDDVRLGVRDVYPAMYAGLSNDNIIQEQKRMVYPRMLSNEAYWLTQQSSYPLELPEDEDEDGDNVNQTKEVRRVSSTDALRRRRSVQQDSGSEGDTPAQPAQEISAQRRRKQSVNQASGKTHRRRSTRKDSGSEGELPAQPAQEISAQRRRKQSINQDLGKTHRRRSIRKDSDSEDESPAPAPAQEFPAQREGGSSGSGLVYPRPRPEVMVDAVGRRKRSRGCVRDSSDDDDDEGLPMFRHSPDEQKPPPIRREKIGGYSSRIFTGLPGRFKA